MRFLPDVKIRVTFLIRKLERGGAERQLLELARGLDKRRFDVSIVTFYDGGAFDEDAGREDGVHLVSLKKGSRYDVLPFLRRFVRTLRTLKPDIVHGYMTVANELSLAGGRMCGARVVWGLRASDLGIVETGAERTLLRVGARLSRYADRIIANAESVRAFYTAQGYSAERFVVIFNGIDTERFSVLPAERQSVRAAWGVTDDQILVGRAARLHPMKDYPSFIRAAALVGRRHVNARFACIGDGTDAAELRELASREGIADRMIWGGGRNDMPAIYNALDLSVSSSIAGEGFPNAIAEAMACGTPCVATDIGDSRPLIDGLGIIVPPGQPEALAQGILRMTDPGPAYSRQQVRQRITDHFSARRLVSATEAEFERLASERSGDRMRKSVA
jgi:glycosyltransferase involved in cell wall biosynthesis